MTAPPIGLPIGVFDSGVGGLTVLRALRGRLPQENFLYLGDTARLPYGTKTAHTVSRYALQAADMLVARGIKCLVVACNTASSVALTELREHLAPLPVLGVIEPGAEAACRVSSNGKIVVIATEGTVQGGAYLKAIRERRAQVQVISRACPLFVALAEEGWVEGEVALAVTRRYLHEFFERATANDNSAESVNPAPAVPVAPELPDTLLLGCTHFPVLLQPIRQVIGPDVHIVDSAETTAAALAGLLQQRQMATDSSSSTRGRVTMLATDGRQRFARVGSLFLHETIATEDVELIDL